MNILFCGDRNIEDGVLISTLSLLKSASASLNIYIMTMGLDLQDKTYLPVSKSFAEYLNKLVKEIDLENSVSLIDATDLFKAEIPAANLNTRFTPCCMLRLFADKIPDLPDKILYLDNDVVCRKNPLEFYEQDISNYEFAGVLDYYGRWFFRKNIFRLDYLNSGVLLLNLAKIKSTGLFERCRKLCAKEKMFMPDQSALNKLATSKKICPRRFNEQRKLHKDTVFQHFTTSFRFLPWIHIVTVKPWQIDKVHSKLKIHEYDEILAEYKQHVSEIKAAL